MKAYIVIPTYNEAENLERIVDQVLALHPTFNIIVVDDNSPDGTGAIADALSRNDSRVHVIHRPHKAGLGTAYIEGFKAALAKGADLIFEMDADFSHDAKYIQDFLEASKRADLVIGSRYVNGVRVEGWRFRRLLLRKIAKMYVSYIMVRPVWDFTAGFRCYRRAVLESIDLNDIRSDGYAFQIEKTYQGRALCPPESMIVLERRAGTRPTRLSESDGGQVNPDPTSELATTSLGSIS